MSVIFAIIIDNFIFSLCLRDRDFDLKERREIDYSLYLLFNQRYIYIYTYATYICDSHTDISQCYFIKLPFLSLSPPSLCRHISHSSQVDDFFEEQKLSSNRRVSFPWQPELWAGSGEVVVDGEGDEVGGGGGGAVDTPTHLRELLKTEREQKVCSSLRCLDF